MLYRLKKVLVDRASINVIQVAFSAYLKYASRNVTIQFFRRLAQCAVSLVLIYMNKTVGGRIKELKNKGIVQLGNSKKGRCRLRERSQEERRL